MVTPDPLEGKKIRNDEIDVIFTFTNDEYAEAGRLIQEIKRRTGVVSNTEAVIKALSLALNQPPEKD